MRKIGTFDPLNSEWTEKSCVVTELISGDRLAKSLALAKEQLEKLNKTLSIIKAFEVNFQLKADDSLMGATLKSSNGDELVKLLELSEEQSKQLKKTLREIQDFKVQLPVQIQSKAFRRLQSS